MNHDSSAIRMVNKYSVFRSTTLPEPCYLLDELGNYNKGKLVQSKMEDIRGYILC